MTRISHRLPLIVFVVVTAIGLVLPVTAYRWGEQADVLRFRNFGDATVDRISRRLGEHISLLVATRALFEARRGNVSYREFASFVGHLNIQNEFGGIQGVGYATIIPKGSENAIRSQIQASYGIDRAVFPATDQQVRAAVAMLEPPDEQNRAALGYDMFSEPARRRAMIAAARTGQSRATSQVELVQQIEPAKQPGFLVYLPFFSSTAPGAAEAAGLPDNLRGFIFAPFRVVDLVNAALSRGPQAPVHLQIYFGEPVEKNLVFTSDVEMGDFGERYAFERPIEIVGQQWHFRIRPAATFSEGPEKSIALLLAALLILMAAALSVSLRSQMKALEASRELFRVSAQAAEQKDFLLQEMKHRIKNSIARMLAIARQTANQTNSLDEFIKSYSNRLQAMAAAQDLLTQSHESADVGALLHNEMRQVFGDDFTHFTAQGPAVGVGVNATQALALVFHELATNALKYGNLTEAGSRLNVEWTFYRASGLLVIDWQEYSPVRAPAAKTSGFGSRLIKSLVAGELGGTLHREMTSDGMHVRMELPERGLK